MLYELDHDSKVIIKDMGVALYGHGAWQNI